jgi:hypothetical protein
VLERCGAFGDEALRTAFVQSGLLYRDRALALEADGRPSVLIASDVL